jgi:hypothetical protein
MPFLVVGFDVLRDFVKDVPAALPLVCGPPLNATFIGRGRASY